MAISCRKAGPIMARTMRSLGNSADRNCEDHEQSAAAESHISSDLEEDMRLDAAIEDLSKIKIARLERGGDISFIKAE